MNSDVSRRSTKKSVFLRDFKQQQISAWVPRYRPNTIAPTFIGCGVILVPLGVAILLISSNTSSDIKEIHVDYTNCKSIKNSSLTCAEYIQSHDIWLEGKYEICQCDVEFELSKPMKGKKIYMYYTIENFHQNVRKYAKSKDENQLLGKIGTFENPTTASKDCQNFDKDAEGKIIYPCGAIANSMFNDSIKLFYKNELKEDVSIHLIRKGLAWSSDRNYKYKNPPYNRSDKIWEKFANPKGWSRSIFDLDPDDQENNGVQNEDFMIWMRVAAFSNFRKPYRIIETASQAVLGDRLPVGKYHLLINYTYEVVSFGGKKGVLLASTTIFGHQNMFQGYTAIGSGAFCMVLGFLFLVCGCNARHGKGSFTKSETDAE